MTLKQRAAVLATPAQRLLSAGAALSLLVAVLLPLHSASLSHNGSFTPAAQFALAAQSGAHDTHEHPRSASDPCGVCLALTQARTAPVHVSEPRLESPFEESLGIAIAVSLLLPAAPASAQNHSRAPPACA